ncbi:MAG TPA: Na+/H+ antiporter NhaA [Acidimicrobiales bacterium]|nr:Na+/H+ antiporter NhaA [Acidimicrobiales bacterium]
MTDNERVPNSRAAAVREFLQTETAGALVLLLAAVAALVWANSPVSSSYDRFWTYELRIDIGMIHRGLAPRHFVNEGLMAIFFFVVGLEIKREFVAGELHNWRRAALPALAALGGMIAPSLVYLMFNFGGPGGRGWGIPMATDIAFAVGVLALLGRRVPPSLRIFLLTLAVVDDVGAIVVMAVAYATVTGLIPLVAAMAALCIPAPPGKAGGSPRGLLVQRLQQLLHPLASFLVMPLFALANAGVSFEANSLRAPGAPSVFMGVVLGLVLGKLVGISALSWIAIRLGLGELPDGVGFRQLFGAAAVAGIGFTVSLFIAQLAFAAPELVSAAKLGVLLSSVLASVVGFVLLRTPECDAKHVTRNT